MWPQPSSGIVVLGLNDPENDAHVNRTRDGGNSSSW